MAKPNIPYKVIAGAIPELMDRKEFGPSKTGFNHGDIIPAEFPFKEGEADMLIEEGFIEPAEVAEAPAEPEYIDHVVTQEDLDSNPELAEKGTKVDEVIQLPNPAYVAPAPAKKKRQNN